MTKSKKKMTPAEINKPAPMNSERCTANSHVGNTAGNSEPLNWDAIPIAFTATAQEIQNACADSCHIFWISTKSQLDCESFGVVVASNPRTGVICRVGAFEALSPRSTEVLDSDLHYIVELEINKSTLVFEWITNDMDAGFAHIKKCAHESFIKLCAFAGIRAGYGLTINPETY